MELLLYIVIVPALRIFISPLGVYLDYHTSQTELRDDNCMRLPAPRPSLECVLLWLLDWEWVAFQVTSTRSWLQGRKTCCWWHIHNFQNYSKVGWNNSFIPELSEVYEWGRGEFHVPGSLEYAGLKGWNSFPQNSQPLTWCWGSRICDRAPGVHPAGTRVSYKWTAGENMDDGPWRQNPAVLLTV